MRDFTAEGFNTSLKLGNMDFFEAMRQMPGAGSPADASALSQIPETVALEPFPGKELPSQNPFTDLAFLRAQFPFIPILPFPTRTISVVLAASAAKSIMIPDHAKLALIQGDGDYWVSRNGVASVPTTANSNATNTINDGTNASIYRPEFAFFYVGGLSELSIISANEGRIVQIAFWQAENWPGR